MKTLVIAEKPSVARDIASTLGAAKRENFFESDRYIISSAIGHLLELELPPNLREHARHWVMHALPLIPEQFSLAPIARTKAQLGVLENLFARDDVSLVVNACDAGREGELIFRYIVQFCRLKKPIARMWLQSMTQAAIRECASKLRTDAEMRPLADAAYSRSEADWLVGINCTRALSLLNSQSGYNLTPVGRVQTPTLALIVGREQEILSFVSKDYWTVKGTFKVSGGIYTGTWFDATKKEDKEKLWQREGAEAIKRKCEGKTGTATEKTQQTTQLPPLLYDLTSLQREANQKFGFPAKTTLGIAQALYETHKVLTYPRTDARHLPEDYLPTAKSVIESLLSGPNALFAAEILGQNWLKPNKRIFDNSKISDHFAIIPTTTAPRSLSDSEQKIYELVVKRFLAAFFPAAEFLETERLTRIEGEQFRSKGKVLISPGWLRVYNRTTEEDEHKEEADTLCPLVPNESALVTKLEIKQDKTKPPARLTEASLLSAMEHAGRLVKEEELKEALGSHGLGTPATRAAIIESLLEYEYILRKGKELNPTPKGTALIEQLKKLQLEALCSPTLTAEWEFRLGEIERGRFSRKEFMQGIDQSVILLVNRVKGAAPALAKPTPSKLLCPKCKHPLLEEPTRFVCESNHIFLSKTIAKRPMTPAELEVLLAQGSVGPLQGFTSKEGKPFAAKLKLGVSGGMKLP